MTNARAWPVRAMYMLIAAALVISLFITAAPAQMVSAQTATVKAEWSRVSTPTYEGFVLAPESLLIDYALASEGEVAYAIVEAYYKDEQEGCAWNCSGYRLLKSDDHGATWDDITDALDKVIDPDDEDENYIQELMLVATDWDDPDFVAVALQWYDDDEQARYISVFFSTDGGDTFIDAGEVEAGGRYFDDTDGVVDLIVSPEVGGKRDIAIGGMGADGLSAIFRCTVTGDSAGAWKDATEYAGWDDDANLLGTNYTSYLVTDLIFSPNYADDKTILAVTVWCFNQTDGYWYGTVHLQSGTFSKTSGAWNEAADFPKAVPVKQNVYFPVWLTDFDARAIAGVALPSDYLGTDTNRRFAWVWVNYFDETIPRSQGEILRVRNAAVDPVDTQIYGMPWLTNVSYWGTIAEGKAIAGVLAYSSQEALYDGDLIKECCEGVQVYRNAGVQQMEICCLEWDPACKPPTGRITVAVSYASEDKAYAVALGGRFSYDEGAWSFTMDDGDTWNQLSLIDTHIDYLSDVAVSPDCNKMMLVSINLQSGCECDSVWLRAVNLPEAPEYSGKWLRTWSGRLVGTDWKYSEGGMLRLAPEETTGDTVYLFDYGTPTIYYNDLETLNCWKKRSTAAAGITSIVDLAVKDKATIYVLDADGDVSMSDNYGASLSWTDRVKSKVAEGHTIAVWNSHVLVGGADGRVSYSDDGGLTFTLLDEEHPFEGRVTVAFDTYFNQNDAIYAAVDAGYSGGGIYLWIIGESEEWTDLDAYHGYAYTGIVLDRPSPANPMTSPETGGVLYASYYQEWDGWTETGVARCLTPIVEICCGVGKTEWDYLTETKPEGWFYGQVQFTVWPDALKICGCLTPDSNSKLFAIDGLYRYDMVDHEDGAVWTFEDCYAKKAVTLKSPADGFVVPPDACDCCNAPFTLKWDRLCDACCYEIQFAYDQEFTDLFDPDELETAQNGLNDGPYEDGVFRALTPMNPSQHIGCWFNPEFTYYWRVRSRVAETDQWIRSWWSEPRKFTVAPVASAAAITLGSPVPGALNQPVKNLGFSWNLLATADKFDWVLSKNADLTSPVESKVGLTRTAYTCTKTLDYGTTYYWQVTAYKGGAAISMSAVGTFTTAAHGAFCCPQCGLCFDTQAQLQAHVAEAHGPPPTPFWVWVVIAIGAVLVIVVIVLIFRTRRV